MPVDERTFAAEIAGWVTEFLNGRPDLPFDRAVVEEHVQGTARRHDFRLYRRHTNQPVLTGEIKMPDSPQGNHPLNAGLVDDALGKAFEAGIRYCFTWNVRQFVLFDSHMPGVPFAQRHIEGPADVVEATVSDDVSREWAREAIHTFWEGFLERFADLVLARRAFEPTPIDQRFISWLEGALEDPIAHTEDTLARLTKADSGFNLRLSAWMLRQGWEPSDQEEQRRQNLERASRLSCYILVTRLVFYEVLRRRFRQMSPLTVEGLDTPEQLREVLEARFGEAVRYSHDYETIFEPDEGDMGYTIPFMSPQSPRDWARLVQRIEEFDFSSLGFDVIGQMYERLIGGEERRRFGQFYTSPDVVDLINAFCIRKPEDRVLDPACGGGTFLVRAYSRKRALAQSSGRAPRSHERLLDEIYGIDIAAFPAQLSTINLAVRHLSDEPNYPLVARDSFFNAQQGNPLYNRPLSDGLEQMIPLEEVDAVVGNPPYIRQESIGSVDKANYAELFRREWPGHTKLSGRSDIYAYFFTHAASLLSTGGYLGFVTSIGWLDTDYGFKLQEFFLRNFRIVAVIESQVEKWFEDARVTTAVTILQREPDRRKRDASPVRFIQLRKPLSEIYTQALDRPLSEEGEAARQEDMNAVRDLIEEIDADQTTDYWRVKVRTQRELLEEGTIPAGDDAGQNESAGYSAGKWGQYVRAPDSWFDLRERARDLMVPLQELALVRFGFKTGADKFFCVRDVTQHYLDSIPDPQAFLDRWGISRKDTRRIRIVRDGANVEHLVEKRFLEPELHSLMEVKRAVVRKGDVQRMVINAPVPRARLRRTRLLEYVAYAEKEGNGRPVEPSLAEPKPVPGTTWDDASEVGKGRSMPSGRRRNSTDTLCHSTMTSARLQGQTLYDVWATPPIDARLLWATLNSTGIVMLSKHQFGRPAGIEGNLDTHVIDVNMMLVPDIRKASPEAAATCHSRLRGPDVQTKRQGATCTRNSASRTAAELDDATLEILGIEDATERAALRERLYRDVTELQKAIREREIIAQRDRANASRRGGLTPQAIAAELWTEHSPSLNLLQFPEDFIGHLDDWESFDLPSGGVEAGEAMVDVGGLLRAGTIRVGGTDGEVIDVGSVSRARFLEALSLCHREGQVRLPSDEVCNDAVRTASKNTAGSCENAAPSLPNRERATRVVRRP